jgi:hypothetical protein
MISRAFAAILLTAFGAACASTSDTPPALAPLPVSTSAEPDCRANPHLARAKDQYERLMFDRAASSLQRAIEQPNNCRQDLAEIYRLKAFIDAING